MWIDRFKRLDLIVGGGYDSFRKQGDLLDENLH